jgi:hypothetical protein
MKETNIFKDIFRLAVRLAGLFFLCIGLKDLVVQTFMVLAQARGTPLINIVTNFLPVAFTLTLALWLLRGNWLIRMAYPEAGKLRQPMLPAVQPTEPEVATVAAPKLSEMEKAEQKLSALVGKKEGQPA